MPNLTSKDDQFRIKRTHIKTPDTYLQPDVSVDMRTMDQEKFCILNLNSKLIPVTDRYQSGATHVKQIGFINLSHESSPKYDIKTSTIDSEKIILCLISLPYLMFRS